MSEVSRLLDPRPQRNFNPRDFFFIAFVILLSLPSFVLIAVLITLGDRERSAAAVEILRHAYFSRPRGLAAG